MERLEGPLLAYWPFAWSFGHELISGEARRTPIGVLLGHLERMSIVYSAYLSPEGCVSFAQGGRTAASVRFKEPSREKTHSTEYIDVQFITDSHRIIDLSIIKVMKFRTVILCILYLSLDL